MSYASGLAIHDPLPPGTIYRSRTIAFGKQWKATAKRPAMRRRTRLKQGVRTRIENSKPLFIQGNTKTCRCVHLSRHSYRESISKVLDAIGAAGVLKQQTAILIKPNLVNASPFPVTTAPQCVEAIIAYVRSCSQAAIVIGEGCGDANLETPEVFDRLGYRDLARRHDVELVDLNRAPLEKLNNGDCSVFPQIYLPKIAMSHFLLSVPVLKAHSFSKITGTLKNMIGLAPPKYYSGQYGTWKKAVFHNRMHQSIIDLNKYRTPDLSLMDATVGMPDFHLGGAHCDPPLNKLIAGFDPVEVDRKGAELLGLEWTSIAHLADQAAGRTS